MNIREFRLQGKRHILVWKIAQDGPTVHVWYGVLNSPNMQHTEDTKGGKDIGRSNERSPEQVAEEDIDRQVLLRERDGYVEYVDGRPLRKIETEFSLDRLPPGLAFYKPYNSLSDRLFRLLEERRAWAVRKRDGDAFPLVRTSSTVSMYTRKMLPYPKTDPDHLWTDRFEHIAAEALDLPGETLLLGELVAYRGTDDKKRVNSLTKSKTEKALDLQEGGGWAFYYVWDVAFYQGRDVLSSWTHGDRLQLAQDLCADGIYLLPPDIYEVDDFEIEQGEVVSDVLRMEAIRLGWEGWVVVDPEGVLGDKAWSLRGKPDRSKGVSDKCKPYYENDFVAMWNPEDGIGEYGTGKYQGMVKSLELYQYDRYGELVRIGRVASGLTAKQKKDLADPSVYPIVVEVGYDSRYYMSKGQGSNALYVPRFVRVREDKTPEECIDEEL